METSRESYYKSITYFASIALIIGLFLEFKNANIQALYDLTNGLIATIVFVSALLWIKNRVLLIGLVMYLISWNIDLLTNPLIALNGLKNMNINPYKISLAFNAFGVLCLIFGFIERIEVDYLTKRININIRITVGLLVGLTLTIQLITRILLRTIE